MSLIFTLLHFLLGFTKFYEDLKSKNTCEKRAICSVIIVKIRAESTYSLYRDRDRYVQGDYRFRFGYCKHNPRKMVKTWAEKEMRNLLRYAVDA